MTDDTTIPDDLPNRAREISYCLGVADHGVTGRYPVKTHDFDYLGGGE